MSIRFYPHEEDLLTSSLQEKLEALAVAAEDFKAAVLDQETKKLGAEVSKKLGTPKDIAIAYQWDDIAEVLHKVREMPIGSADEKRQKIEKLRKLEEIYEVLRSAKMPRLEVVRSEISNEIKILGG